MPARRSKQYRLFSVHFAMIIVLVAALLAGCSKLIKGDDHPSLPPYTEKGANTFGCTIDGKIMIPQGVIGGMYQTLRCSFETVKDTTVFSIAAGDFIHDMHVYLSAANIRLYRDTSFFIGSQQTGSPAWAAYTDDNSGSSGYRTQSARAGQFIIKRFSKDSGFISGTFWFDALDTASGKMVEVRDGRFDLKY